MATYKVDELVKEIKVALDENVSSEALISLGDTDTLTLEEIIKSKIEPAAKTIEANAPYYLLDGGIGFADSEQEEADNSLAWASGEKGIGYGIIKLPDNFLRLVSFKMSDWDYSVSEAISEYDSRYAMQFSRFGGIKGNPQRPVIAIVQRPDGLCLQFFSCRGGAEVFVEIAQYIAIPKISASGTIELCEKLKPAIVHYAAYLTALTLGSAELASALMSMSKDLAEIFDNQQVKP